MRSSNLGFGNFQVGLGDSMTSLWENLAPHWQLAVVGGGVLSLLLLLMLFCCVCCCRSRKKNSCAKARGTSTAHSLLPTTNPPSVVNRCVMSAFLEGVWISVAACFSAANSAYYQRKMNGTSTPIMSRAGIGPGPMEMASLLPSHGVPPPYGEPFHGPHDPHGDEPYHILEIPANQVRNVTARCGNKGVLCSVLQLKVGDLLGEGQFGVVYKGFWSGGLLSGDPLQVRFFSITPMTFSFFEFEFFGFADDLVILQGSHQVSASRLHERR